MRDRGREGGSKKSVRTGKTDEEGGGRKYRQGESQVEETHVQQVESTASWTIGQTSLKSSLEDSFSFFGRSRMGSMLRALKWVST